MASSSTPRALVLAVLAATAISCGSSSTKSRAAFDGGAGAPTESAGATSSSGGAAAASAGGAAGERNASAGGAGGASAGGVAGAAGAVGFTWPDACSGRVEGTLAVELVAHGAQLVDVRTADEFAAGHIDGAVNIPLADLATRMGEIDSTRPVVVYCASGSRADAAATQLCAAGYRVYDLGPRSNWPG